jgi:amino-acid N-acetyltransferase
MAETDLTVTDITIRKATADDLERISAFIKDFVESGQLLPRTYSELEGLLGHFFIAEALTGTPNSELVGCAGLDIYNRKLAEIRSLAVSPRARGLGVGKRLVDACVELAHDREIFEIMAISSKEAFFRACGFDFTLPDERKAFFLQTRDNL